MPVNPALGTFITPDPKGWAAIRSAWSRHQVANQGGYHMEILRDFLVATLADLSTQPDMLSPEGYARFFDTMDALVPWRKLCTYMPDVRRSLMVSMGLLAQSSGSEMSCSGRPVEAQWARQMKQATDKLATIYTPAIFANDVTHVVQSPLSAHFKLRACKNVPSPSTWLAPTVASAIQLLLPPKEQDAFKYFAWNRETPALNKILVATFLPAAHALLDLSLPEDAWAHQPTVAKAIAAMAPKTRKKSTRHAFDLPVDFLGEP